MDIMSLHPQWQAPNVFSKWRPTVEAQFSSPNYLLIPVGIIYGAYLAGERYFSDQAVVSFHAFSMNLERILWMS